MACGTKPPNSPLNRTYTIAIDGAPSSVKLSRTLITPEAIWVFPERTAQVNRTSNYEEILIQLTKEYQALIRREQAMLRSKLLEEQLKGYDDAIARAIADAKARSQIYYLESLRQKFNNFRQKLFGTGA